VLSLDALVNKALSRRSFLAGAGATAAAAAVTGCSNNTSGFTPTLPGPVSYTDADILNFALNLEYLEAQFYLYAATGKGLLASDTAAPSGYTGKYTQGTVTTTGNITVGQVGTVSGGTALTTAQQGIINEIAFEEQAHVRFLRAALGSAAVPMPSIDLTFFSSLAMVAGITTVATGAGSYTPYDNFNDFLIGSFIFEDVGVTAYAGAAPLISAAGVASGYLTAAAGILAVEAYHAAYARTAITAASIAANSSTLIGIANKVEALRAMLSDGDAGAPIAVGSTTSTGNTGVAGSSTSVEVALALPTFTATSMSSTNSTIVACDPINAIGFARTVNQVHHIVYGNGGVGANKGGFFPNGTNSIFSTTTA
jgi:hypothetical protein